MLFCALRFAYQKRWLADGLGRVFQRIFLLLLKKEYVFIESVFIKNSRGLDSVCKWARLEQVPANVNFRISRKNVHKVSRVKRKTG